MLDAKLLKEWSIRKSSKWDKLFILGSAIALIVFFIMMSPVTNYIFETVNPVVWGLAWLVVVIALVVIHEALHGLFFWLYSERVQYGIKWKTVFGPTPYATSIGSKFTKRQFQMIGIAPQLLTVVLLGLSLATFRVSSPVSMFALMSAMTNLAGGCVDIYSAFQVGRYSNAILVEDTGDGYKIWQQD